VCYDKNEPNGFFSQWLYVQEENEIPINITQPQGGFLLNMETQTTALCLGGGGGVGITPFVAFANALLTNTNNKSMHLIYCALTKNDFIFVNEFNEIMKQKPYFTLKYRDTDTHGLLTAEDIIKYIDNLDHPRLIL
jgi:ferredoxin-NADP reductase